MTVLVPDTSSLINIHDIYIGNKHITNVLDNLFTVQAATEIVIEMKRRKSLYLGYEQIMIPYAQQIRQRFHRQQEYEQLLRQHWSSNANPNRNRGERYNCSLAAYLVRKREATDAIMLTDDRNALRGFIGWFDEHFRATMGWGSLDLLQYLYFVLYPKWQRQPAEDALRSVNARIGGDSQEAVKRLLQARRRLRALDAMMHDLPNVKRRGSHGV